MNLYLDLHNMYIVLCTHLYWICFFFQALNVIKINHLNDMIYVIKIKI